MTRAAGMILTLCGAAVCVVVSTACASSQHSGAGDGSGGSGGSVATSATAATTSSTGASAPASTAVPTSGVPTSGASTVQEVPPVLPTRPSGLGRTATATDTDNGRAITVQLGTSITVTLHSTYWRFDALPSGGVLASGEQVTVPGTGDSCVPGAGCGTASETFTASGPGTVVVTAHRTSCGEAMRCTGDQGSYRLTVVVRS